MFVLDRPAVSPAVSLAVSVLNRPSLFVRFFGFFFVVVAPSSIALVGFFCLFFRRRRRSFVPERIVFVDYPRSI